MYGEKGKKTGNIRFETMTAEKHSPALRETPRLIEGGYIRKFVKAWLEKWEGEGKGLQIGSSGEIVSVKKPTSTPLTHI